MLDRYSEPRRDAATLASRREALLDQLGWLEDEASALVPLLSTLPAWAVEQAPMPDDLTAKETFAALAALDRDLYPDWLSRLKAEDTPALASPTLTGPESANTRTLDDLLADLRAARATLRETMAAVPTEAWGRTVTLDGETTDLYGVALAIVQRDADHLKTLAYRLHQADLRPPKPGDDVPRKPEM